MLKAFKNRLSEDTSAYCYFVSQDNAADFCTLSEKAQIAVSLKQYLEDILSKEQKDQFKQIQEEWGEADSVIFDFLTRSHVVIFPEKELDSQIESYGDLYFQSGGKSAFANFRDVLENHFNKPLTTETVRAAIKSQGHLQFKEWAFDPSIPQRLKEETDLLRI